MLASAKIYCVSIYLIPMASLLFLLFIVGFRGVAFSKVESNSWGTHCEPHVGLTGVPSPFIFRLSSFYSTSFHQIHIYLLTRSPINREPTETSAGQLTKFLHGACPRRPTGLQRSPLLCRISNCSELGSCSAHAVGTQKRQQPAHRPLHSGAIANDMYRACCVFPLFFESTLASLFLDPCELLPLHCGLFHRSNYSGHIHPLRLPRKRASGAPRGFHVPGSLEWFELWVCLYSLPQDDGQRVHISKRRVLERQ